MRFVKSFLVGFMAALLSLCLAGMVATTVFAATLGNPANLKTWLGQSKIYEAGINNLLEQARKSPDSSTLSQPEVQNVIKQTLTPEIARSSIEQVIDGIYHWLDGKAPKPDFRIDLSGLKANLAENAGNTAIERLKRLPICTKAQLREFNGDVDPFSVPCQTSGLDFAAQKQKISNEILTSKDILADPVITADTIKSTNNNRPFYENARQLPEAYQWLVKAPWVLGSLGLILAAGIIWLSQDHRKGLGRVAKSLIGSGLFLLLSVLLANLLTNKLTNSKNLFKPGVSADLQASVISLIRAITTSANYALLSLAGGLVVLGVGGLVYLHLTRPKVNADIVPSKESLPEGPKAL